MDSLKNINGITGAGKQVSKQDEIENRRVKKAYQDRPSASRVSRSDRADISETGKAMLALHSEAADILQKTGATTTDSGDAARLGQLKREIADGVFLSEDMISRLADKLLNGTNHSD